MDENKRSLTMHCRTDLTIEFHISNRADKFLIWSITQVQENGAENMKEKRLVKRADVLRCNKVTFKAVIRHFILVLGRLRRSE